MLIKYRARLGATRLVLGCRNMEAGEAAKRRVVIESQSNSSLVVSVWHVDMADYSSVVAFARRMQGELPRCDALLANAGISTNDFSLAEGLERTLTINVVSTFLLSMLALPLLGRTAEASNTQMHLTIVGSNVHYFVDPSQLQALPAGKRFAELSRKSEADMGARYFLSKLIVMQCAQEFAARSAKISEKSKPRVIINCPSPGWCKTALFRQDDGGFMGRNTLRLIGRTAEVGARTLTSAIITGPETHGRYVSECRPKPASVFLRSPEGLQLQRGWNACSQGCCCCSC